MTSKAYSKNWHIFRQQNILANTKIIFTLWPAWPWRDYNNIKCIYRLEPVEFCDICVIDNDGLSSGCFRAQMKKIVRVRIKVVYN